MEGYYSKAIVEIKAGTMGANLNDFVSHVQIEKRLDKLDTLKRNIKSALDFIENEERVLKAALENQRK